MSDARPPLDEGEVRRHADAVRDLARRLVRDGGTAEDVAQEAWLVALEGARRGDVPLRWWLRGVVRNVARHFRRADATRRRHEAAAARAEAFVPAACPVEQADLHRRLLADVLALDEPYRSTVLLRHFHGLSSAEIARKDGVPEGTVRSRLKRGLDLLRERLDREHAGGRRAWAGLLAPLGFAADGRAPGSVLAPLGTGAKAAVALAATAVAAVVLVLASASQDPAAAHVTRGGTRAAVAPGSADDEGATHDATSPRPGRARAAVPPAPGDDAAALREVRVVGRVVDAHGAPVEDAGVRAVVRLPDTSPYDESPGEIGRTRDHGAFDLPAPPAPEGAPIWVVVTSRGRIAVAKAAPTTDPSQRTLVVLDDVGTAWRFRVVDPVGAGIAGAAILLGGGDPAQPVVWLGAADGGGWATLDVPATREWKIAVRAAGYAPSVVSTTARPHRVELLPALRIAGRVVDSADRPVPGARVTCGEATVVARDGTFVFEALSLDAAWGPTRELEAHAEGFCDAAGRASPGDEGVVLRMRRPRDLRVTIRRPDGGAAPHSALVTNGRWTVVSHGGTGRFDLSAAAPGPAPLRAEWSPDWTGDEDDSPPRFVGQASPDVPEGEGPFDLAIDLRPVETSYVPVRVVDADGAPQSGVPVTFRHADARHPEVPDVTDEGGRAVLVCPVPAGTVVTVATLPDAPDGGLPRTAGWIEAVTRSSAGDAPLVLVLERTVRIALDATDDDGRALPQDVALAIEPHIRFWQSPDPDDPRAVLTYAGRWFRAIVRAPGYAPRLVETFAPATGTSRVPLRFSRPARVRGRVVDAAGVPQPGARVVVRSPVTWDVAAEWPEARNVGEDGAFDVPGVQPGAARIVVERNAEAHEAAVDLVLSPGEDRVVGDVVVAGLVWVRGVVRGPDRRPVGGAVVVPLDGDPPPREDGALGRPTSTAADGTFALAVAAHARGLLVAKRDGLGAAATPFDAGDGRDDVSLRLGAEARLRVVVVSSGRPALSDLAIRVEAPGSGSWDVTTSQAGDVSFLPDGTRRAVYEATDPRGLAPGPVRLRLLWERRTYSADATLVAGGTTEVSVRVE